MRRGATWSDCARGLVLRGSLLAAGATGCAGYRVDRVDEGRTLPGRFIGVDAYASYLRGALAEEAGDLPGALQAYEAAGADDGDDPELWTRIGRTRCALHPGAERGLAALQTALRIDPGYEPARTAEAACAVPAASAPGLDVENLRTQIGLTHGPAVAGDEAGRRIEAATLLRGERVAAWEALATWGTMHGDVGLAVRGLVGVGQRAPASRYALGHVAITLAGRGYGAEARQLAASLLDAEGDRTSGGLFPPAAALPLVARLAIDEALLRRDLPVAVARAVRAHLGSATVAARAWLQGDAALAHALVRDTRRAEPDDRAARLVEEGASGRAARHLLGAGERGASVPLDVAVPFAHDVLATESSAAASQALSLAPPVALAAGDARLTPLLVDLAIAGAIPPDALPVDARIELAARLRTPPDARDVEDASVDERHRLLGATLLRPTDARTQSLASSLAGAAPEESLVAVALARIALAQGVALPEELRGWLEPLGSADPLVASVLLDAARASGAPAAVDRARHRLLALARTPAEKALVAE